MENGTFSVGLPLAAPVAAACAMKGVRADGDTPRPSCALLTIA